VGNHDEPNKALQATAYQPRLMRRRWAR